MESIQFLAAHLGQHAPSAPKNLTLSVKNSIIGEQQSQDWGFW